MLLTGIALLAALAFVRSGSTSEASDDGLRTYRVTIENETHGQPFSPGVAVTHRRSAHLFHVGDAASPGIEAIAEDGNEGPAVAAEMGAQGITNVFDINRPITREGTTVGSFTDEFTFEIKARPGDRLSLAVTERRLGHLPRCWLRRRYREQHRAEQRYSRCVQRPRADAPGGRPERQ